MSTKIEVAIRVRPILDHEKKMGLKSSKMIVNTQANEIRVANEDQKSVKSFKFDTVLGEDATQDEVFSQIKIENIISKVVEGYNSTIFAYGQTGSGKTYTMEGFHYEVNPNDKTPHAIIDPDSPDIGIIPRAIETLFKTIKRVSKSQKKVYTVYCSYLQIYNEKIFDLLNPSQLSKIGQNNPGLRLRWNKKEQFVVENLYVFECRTPGEVLEHFFNGVRNKIVASHRMNLASSRAHSILSLRVEAVDSNDPDNIIVSKLDLVDLAGSERSALVGNGDQTQQKESIEINKSLFILRQVITTLADLQKSNITPEQRARVHIPYRDSKLTSLLKQSIGGNNFCLMIACLAPVDKYIDENISTLTYATKATLISNEPVRNDDPKTRMINELKAQVGKLTAELNKANDHIAFLSQITNEKVEKYGMNFLKKGGENDNDTGNTDPELLEASQKEKKLIDTFYNQLANSPGNNDADKSGHASMMKRMIDSINMVRELLKSSKEMREKFDKLIKKNEEQENEIFHLQLENQDLRDKLQIHENVNSKNSKKDLRGNDSDDYEDNTDITHVSKNMIADEIFSLKKDKKNLEKRIKNLEIENHNLMQKLYMPSNIPKHKEPNRSILEVSPHVYNYNNVMAMKTRLMEKMISDESTGQFNTQDNTIKLNPLVPYKESRTVDLNESPMGSVVDNNANISRTMANSQYNDTYSPGQSDGKSDKLNRTILASIIKPINPNPVMNNIRRNQRLNQLNSERSDPSEQINRKILNTELNKSFMKKIDGPFIFTSDEHNQKNQKKSSSVHR